MDVYKKEREATAKYKKLCQEQEAQITAPVAKEILDFIKLANGWAGDLGAWDYQCDDYSLALKVQELENKLEQELMEKSKW